MDGRHALCIGINKFKKPPSANWLNGCVNDANDMAGVLHDLLGFSQDQITLLTDEHATKAHVYSALQDMVKKARSGKISYLVFSFSSNGTQVPDTSGDESDRADEALCAYDIRAAGNQWDRRTVIVDGELHDLFSQLPPNVLLEAYFDTCHSGTGLKLADLLPGRRPKFLPPPTPLGMDEVADSRLSSYRELAARVAHPHHILFAACLASQTAADALFQKRYNGAFTYYLVKRMRSTRNRVSRKELLTRIGADLRKARFAQTPQLEAPATDRVAAAAAA